MKSKSVVPHEHANHVSQRYGEVGAGGDSSQPASPTTEYTGSHLQQITLGAFQIRFAFNQRSLALWMRERLRPIRPVGSGHALNGGDFSRRAQHAHQLTI